MKKIALFSLLLLAGSVCAMEESSAELKSQNSNHPFVNMPPDMIKYIAPFCCEKKKSIIENAKKLCRFRLVCRNFGLVITPEYIIKQATSQASVDDGTDVFIEALKSKNAQLIRLLLVHLGTKSININRHFFADDESDGSVGLSTVHNTPLIYVIRHRRVNSFDILVKCEDLKVNGQIFETDALLWAVGVGNRHFIEGLLDFPGTDVNAVNKFKHHNMFTMCPLANIPEGYNALQYAINCYPCGAKWLIARLFEHPNLKASEEDLAKARSFLNSDADEGANKTWCTIS